MTGASEAGRPDSVGPATPTLLDLLRAGVLDAELAALVWLLLEARVALVVAGMDGQPNGRTEGPRVGRAALLRSLLELLPPTARRIPVDPAGTGLDRLTSADAATAWLVGLDLGPAPAPGVRLAFRSLSRGSTLACSIEADSLEAVFARLRRPDLRLSDEELTFLGVVLIVRSVDLPGRDAIGDKAVPGRGDRVVAAHYVRPLSKDPAGHVQRPAPAVLATWEPRDDAFEHFAWGITADLAGRVGLRPGDLDANLGRRREYLAGLVGAGIAGSNELRTALDGFRLADRSESAG